MFLIKYSFLKKKKSTTVHKYDWQGPKLGKAFVSITHTLGEGLISRNIANKSKLLTTV